MTYDSTIPAETDGVRPLAPDSRRRMSRLFDHPLLGELFGIDPRGLAVFRICLAVLLLADLAGRVPFLVEHYTDKGLVPRDLMMDRMGKWTLSLYWMNGTAGFAAVMFCAAAVLATMLLVGYKTRMASVASWALLVSLQYRNPLVCSAGDHVLRLLMFWGMFLPLGLCGSVDSRLRGVDAAGDAARRSVLSMATLGLLLQIVFIYIFSAMLKTSPIWRSEGTAIYYTLNLDRMTTDFGRWLLEFPEVLRMVSFATLGLEAGGALLAFLPVGTRYARTLAAAVFIGFHAGLALTMHLILFPFVCMTAWLVFLPPWFWDKSGETRVGAAVVGVWDGLIGRLAAVVRYCGGACGSSIAAPRYRSGWLLNVVAGFWLLYVLGWNIHSVSKKPTPLLLRVATQIGLNETAIDAIAGIGSTLGISQGWIMFSPYPPRDDGWWVAEAELADGRHVDLYRQGEAVSWEKPASIAGEFASHRCRKYMMSLWSKQRRYHARHYARWAREQWNESHGKEERIEAVRLYFMLEYTQPPGEPPVEAKLLVYHWSDAGDDRLVSYTANRNEYVKLLK